MRGARFLHRTAVAVVRFDLYGFAFGAPVAAVLADLLGFFGTRWLLGVGVLFAALAPWAYYAAERVE